MVSQDDARADAEAAAALAADRKEAAAAAAAAAAAEREKEEQETREREQETREAKGLFGKAAAAVGNMFASVGSGLYNLVFGKVAPAEKPSDPVLDSVRAGRVE